VEKASSSGPTNASCKHSNSVPCTARRASVFLTTFKYTPALRASRRRASICVAVRPRYSAATTDRALPATSATSCTIAFFCSRLRAMQNLLELLDGGAFRPAPAGYLCGPAIPSGIKRSPDAGISCLSCTVYAGGRTCQPLSARAHRAVSDGRRVFRQPQDTDDWRQDSLAPALSHAQSRQIDLHSGPHGRGQRQPAHVHAL